MTAPAPVAALPADPEAQQPPPDHATAETVATIAGLLAAAGSVGATYAAAETARAGIVGALTRLGLRRSQAADLVAQDAAAPPPPRVPLSQTARRVGGDGPTYRALYLVNAAKRLGRAVKDPDLTVGGQLAKERRYFAQHKTAQTEREQAAQRLDAASNSYGPLLGWYSRGDGRVTPACAWADGKNFRPDQPTTIGLPGLGPHVGCRCIAGPPHHTAAVIGETATPPVHEHSNTDRQVIGMSVWNEAAHPRAKAGSASGGQFVPLGQARDSNAAKAQQVKTAVADYKATLTAKDAKTRDTQIKGMDDARLEALSRVLYSYDTSDPNVVAARIAVAKELGSRGLDVKDYGALGGGLSAAQKAAAGKRGAPSAPKKPAGKKAPPPALPPVQFTADPAEPVELSAETASLAATPAPLGKPGGPGLWRHKGWKLPNYIEQVAKGIIESGEPDKSRAISIAIGKVRDWAEGKGKVSPEVRAASAKAVAEFEALRASTKTGKG